MSTCFDIRSSARTYSVAVRPGLLDEAFAQNGSYVVVADEWFGPMLSAKGIRPILLRALEETKSLDSIPAIISELRRAGANRETKLLAVGGGIVQDVAAFVASVYMRGIPWIYIPTTLLAMADSCIGGKSSINVAQYKNIVGTFHPPMSVLVDPALVSTLSVEQKVAGLIEACKICYCRGKETFSQYMDLHATPAMTVDGIRELLLLSLVSKKWFIERDEFDRKERLLLNFGHTFGHAIEGASEFRISHGVAVGIGIVCALRLGQLLGRKYESDARPHLLERHVRGLLANVPGLPEELRSLSIANVLDRFSADKKHSAAQYAVVLPAESGDIELLRTPRSVSFIELVRSATGEAVNSLQGDLAVRAN